MITRYSVLYVTGGIQSTVNVSADTNSIVITELVAFRVYLVSVAAINANGIGPYSDAHNVYTSKTIRTCNIVMFN